MAWRVPELLTVCGLDEIAAHASRDVTHVLSILDPDRPEPEFGLFTAPDRTVLRFHDCIEPAPGVVLPTMADIEAVLAFGRAIDRHPSDAGAHLLVHCHAGISRSTAAMTMILVQARPGADEDLAMDEVARIRPQAWPNLRMMELADEMLGRSGRLAAAAARQYARRLAARPDLVDIMAKLDRSREVERARAHGGN